MSRIRTIKPEFWSSPDTAACEDPWARLLFIAMWNLADDNGRGTANPKELAGDVFPNDEAISSADIRRMLGGIRRAFGVTFYMIGGRPYYAIPSWDRHQKIDKRGVGKYPAPEEGSEYNPDPDTPPDQPRRNGSAPSTEGSGGPAESPPSPRRDLDVGTGEQGNRGTGEQGKVFASLTPPLAPLAVIENDQPPRAGARTPARRRARTRPADAAFAEFWETYPRKIGKGAAVKAFDKALGRGADPAELLSAARAYARIRADEDPQFTPHPATWLNQDRHLDPPPEPATGRGRKIDPTANGGLGEGTAAERAWAIQQLKRGS